MELDLARELGKMLKGKKGLSFHTLTNIFSPKTMSAGKALEEQGPIKRRLSLGRGARTRRQLFSLSGEGGRKGGGEREREGGREVYSIT